MIAHAVHEAGGVLEAARRYELFKYVNRICELFEQAGIQDERLAFFKNWSELVYQVDRDATGALDRPGGVKLTEAATRARRTGRLTPARRTSRRRIEFLLDNYGRFGEMVEHHGLDLGRRAQTETGRRDAGPGGGADGLAAAAAAAAPDGRRRRRRRHRLARAADAGRGRRRRAAAAA